jgi:hypothetical protein
MWIVGVKPVGHILKHRRASCQHGAFRYECGQLPVTQPVDATPSNQLIRQYFPWRTDLSGCTRSKPSQGSIPADLT